MKYMYNQQLESAKVSKIWLAIVALGYVVALIVGATGLQARGGYGGWHDKPDDDGSDTIVISGDTAAGENQPGWLFNRDASTSTPYEFTTAESSIGDGSLHVLPIGANPADKFIGEYFYLEEVANLSSISYDFMTADTADAQHFYMNLYTNDGGDPTEFYDCRYNIVPTATSPDPTTGFTTMTYNLSDPATNVTQSGSSSITPCPAAPADLPAGAVLRAIALNVGDTSASDTGLEGYLDNVVLTETDQTTTFDLDPYPVKGKILSPKEGKEVKGVITLKARYDDGDDDNDDAVQWAVREGTCDAGVGTVAGNVDGFSDPFEWDGEKFKATVDTAPWEAGEYCFVFNPTDDPGQNNVRETRNFTVLDNAPENKKDCKHGDWRDFTEPSFDSQRDCMQFVQGDSDNNGHHHGWHHSFINFWKKWWSFGWWR